MIDWEKHWESKPYTVGKTEYLKQVGKTVGGNPISKLQFETLVDGILKNLNPNEDDLVLDLCCGNGLITMEIAKKCSQVVGVDFSQPLLEVAERDHKPNNVRYLRANVLNLDQEKFQDQFGSQAFTKILLYEALQHFALQDLSKLIQNILRLSYDNRLILIGSIPDRNRLWKFYNTPKRRFLYLFRKMIGNESIGTWWDYEYIEEVCRSFNLLTKFHDQNQVLHTAHYRFDVVITSQFDSSKFQI